MNQQLELIPGSHHLNWIFDDLPLFTYQVIMADPPWYYENYSDKGEGRNASAHYSCVQTHEIEKMPVGLLAAPDCALFLWGTSPMLPDALKVMEAWGFTFKGKAFCWVKPTKASTERQIDQICSEGNWKMGLGYGTRSNTEDCWLGTKGSPKRMNKGVREVIVEPLRQHSRKPDVAYEKAQRLFGGPRLELFSRQNREGWDSWGNETGKYDDEQRGHSV